jgi:short-subunit dehydrogenase
MIDQIKDLDVGLLVNNVGTSEAGYLHTFDYQKIVDLININCTSMAVLSADILAIMSKRTQKSALINLSSYMQDRPLPFFAMYAATKAFNRNLTESISL